MTNTDDKIEYLIDNQSFHVSFPDHYTYSYRQIENLFKGNSHFDLQFNKDIRKFQITPKQDMIISNITHRAALILGCFNSTFPITLPKEITYTLDDIPILTHTKLYLTSLQGNPMYATIGGIQQRTPSIIGCMNTMTIDQKPLIYDFEKEGKPLKIKTYTEGLRFLEISLVDFQFQPILLQSPLTLLVKIKPAKNADVFDVLTK